MNYRSKMAHNVIQIYLGFLFNTKMRNNKYIQSFNEHQENLYISDVRSSSFDDILKEYGRDEIIRVIYLWTPFRRSSGDLERMTNEELKFYWEEVVKNYYL